MFNRLVDWKKGSCQLFGWSIDCVFQAKTPKMCWFQLVKFRDMLLFFVISNHKWGIFGFWTAGLTKEEKHFSLFSHVIIVKWISRLRDYENNSQLQLWSLRLVPACVSCASPSSRHVTVGLSAWTRFSGFTLAVTAYARARSRCSVSSSDCLHVSWEVELYISGMRLNPCPTAGFAPVNPVAVMCLHSPK